MVEPNSVLLLERYRRLLEITRDLASTLDLDSLLRHIGQVAADLCSGEAASILLYDESKNVLYFHATTNLDELIMRNLVVPVESSIAGWIVMNRQPIIIGDTQHDPRHFNQVARATNVTTKSLLGVPLITKEKIIGVLEVINKQHGEFDLDDQDILSALGNQAAVAIENARLFMQSDLISELVHELRTPLTSLNTASRLLLRKETSEATRQMVVEAIIKETNRLNEMTTAFLDLSRLESGRVQLNYQDVDIQDLLQECYSLTRVKAAEKGLDIRLEIPEDLPLLRLDPNKIKQVVLNLLSNAVKYTPAPGKVIMSGWISDGDLVIEVADSGDGIASENLKHIFEKFYRVSASETIAQGTGLGLSICKKIVEMHRGNLQVDSTVGVGTTFTVTLPSGCLES
jgi:signal transduction histidine kinase